MLPRCKNIRKLNWREKIVFARTPLKEAEFESPRLAQREGTMEMPGTKLSTEETDPCTRLVGMQSGATAMETCGDSPTHFEIEHSDLIQQSYFGGCTQKH